MRLEHYSGAHIPDPVLRWAVGLTECNVGAFYEDVWGWNVEKKRAELSHVRAAFVHAALSAHELPRRARAHDSPQRPQHASGRNAHSASRCMLRQACAI